ncbi:MAG: hypothetical protein HC884_04675 [Chloroflexaceae bacterium]|nr:hypothetical protein [Chloroflexaceae bacterium]
MRVQWKDGAAITRTMWWRLVGLALVVSLFLAACGGGGGGSSSGRVPPTARATDSRRDGETEPAGGVSLEIGVKGEELLFDKETMEATIAEGEDLTITFHNSSKTQEHNFILLNTSDMSKAEEFNEAATAAGADAFYYPEEDEEMRDLVIGDTYIHNAPEETGTMTIPAPPPGAYFYVCTIPGHFAAGMYGMLTIEAP